MRLRLDWRGPIGAGTLPARAEEIAALAVPAVYLRVKRYGNGRLIAYAGQTRNLIARIDQHIAQLLALQAGVRDAAGEPWANGTALDRFAGLNRLDETLALVRDEIARLRFYWARCDDVECLNILEHLLKTRIEERAARLAGFACENRNAVPQGALDESVAAEIAFEGLAPADRQTLALLLGEEALCAELMSADGA